MALWDWAVTFYASLGHHAAAIVFEVFLLVSLIALRVFSRRSPTPESGQEIEPASLVVQANQ